MKKQLVLTAVNMFGRFTFMMAMITFYSAEFFNHIV